MSSRTPGTRHKSSHGGVATPTGVPLIPVPSADSITLQQQVWVDICQKIVDSDKFSAAQKRVLGSVVNKFSHNVFAMVRKNVTTSQESLTASAANVEPLDQKLVAEVEALDAEYDEVVARVLKLREEVPIIQKELHEKEMVALLGNAEDEDEVNSEEEAVADEASKIGNIVGHVANEVQVLSETFTDVMKDVNEAIGDCTSTCNVVSGTIGKPDSTTQKAILAASTLGNAGKRKTKRKSAAPRKRTTVSKEND